MCAPTPREAINVPADLVPPWQMMDILAKVVMDVTSITEAAPINALTATVKCSVFALKDIRWHRTGRSAEIQMNVSQRMEAVSKCVLMNQARSRASVTLVFEKWRLKELVVMLTSATRLLHYVDMGIARIYLVPICVNVILASDSPK